LTLYSLSVVRPTRLDEALGALNDLGEGARPLAGGTELITLLRQDLVDLDYLVDITRVHGMATMAWDGSTVTVGPIVSHFALATDGLIKDRLPVLSIAEGKVGNIRVRVQGTIGGNLCFADPHSDSATALRLYEAEVEATSAAGTRVVPLSAFLLGNYQVDLAPGELLTAIRIPMLPVGVGSSYQRIQRIERPTVSVAVACGLDEGHRIRFVRLVVGCLGASPVRVNEVEQAIDGTSLEDAIAIVGRSTEVLYGSTEPAGDLLGSAEYKVWIAQTLLQRGLREAAARSVE
jgi:carbon-monoxide dehydrogenase medium subunit